MRTRFVSRILRLVTRESGQPIRNDFLSHESRLVGSPFAIRDLRGPKSRVTRDESLLATRDSWLMSPKSRISSDESRVASGEPASRDLKSIM